MNEIYEFLLPILDKIGIVVLYIIGACLLLPIVAFILCNRWCLSILILSGIFGALYLISKFSIVLAVMVGISILFLISRPTQQERCKKATKKLQSYEKCSECKWYKKCWIYECYGDVENDMTTLMDGLDDLNNVEM